MKVIPPVGVRDLTIGAAFFAILAAIAIWVATGSAPLLVERSAAILSWLLVGLVVSHILIILYFWKTARLTSENPYTKGVTGGSKARKLHRFGRVCGIVFLGALALQGQFFLTLLLLVLFGINWYLQFYIHRAAKRARMEDFPKFRAMKDAGATAAEVYSSAKQDQLEEIAMFRMLRGLYGLSLIEAKEVMIIADGKASSLDEYQAKLVPIIEEALRQEDEE